MTQVKSSLKMLKKLKHIQVKLKKSECKLFGKKTFLKVNWKSSFFSVKYSLHSRKAFSFSVYLIALGLLQVFFIIVLNFKVLFSLFERSSDFELQISIFLEDNWKTKIIIICRAYLLDIYQQGYVDIIRLLKFDSILLF